MFFNVNGGNVISTSFVYTSLVIDKNDGSYRNKHLKRFFALMLNAYFCDNYESVVKNGNQTS